MRLVSWKAVFWVASRRVELGGMVICAETSKEKKRKERAKSNCDMLLLTT